MFSLILPGRRFIELQKWRNSIASLNLVQNASSSLSTTDSNPKSKMFTVSYIIDSLGLTPKLAESISRKVNFIDKANPDSVLNLLRRYGFTSPQISSIVSDYPLLLTSDPEKSLGPKLQFLQSRVSSSSELTEIVSTVPKILLKKGDKTISIYYDFAKDIIEADKSSKFEKISHASPEGSKQENKIRNVSILRELGVPQKLLFSLLTSTAPPVCGKERFEESLKKVLEMGFDPRTSKFIQALYVMQGLSEKTVQEKLNVYTNLGFDVEDVWTMFKKWPNFLNISEKNLLNSFETFISLGFSKDEFITMVKRFPQCLNSSTETVKKKTEYLVYKMKWPLKTIALFPQVLGFSMEKRIVPRCNVIKALMVKGLVGNRGSKLPSMEYVLKSTDFDFLNRYVKKHDDKEVVTELMNVFTGDCES